MLSIRNDCEMRNILIFVAFLVLFINLKQINSHGMMLDPPGRSSRWRFDKSAPKNYNDNGLYCGGVATQWNKYNGKCGLCGDDYGMQRPRPHEIGGRYGGLGVITKTYKNTNTINIGVKISANHLGYIFYDLCNLDQFNIESEECFQKYRLRFVDGNDRYYVGRTFGWINTTVVLPDNMNCRHCVLRWTYFAGNNWGICEDGSGKLGCGPQETFKSCADISITRNIFKNEGIEASIEAIISS